MSIVVSLVQNYSFPRYTPAFSTSLDEEEAPYPYRLTSLGDALLPRQADQLGSLLAGTVAQVKSSFEFQSTSGSQLLCPSTLRPEMIGRTVLITSWAIVPAMCLSLESAQEVSVQPALACLAIVAHPFHSSFGSSRTLCFLEMTSSPRSLYVSYSG